jgi:hypothetical protein
MIVDFSGLYRLSYWFDTAFGLDTLRATLLYCRTARVLITLHLSDVNIRDVSISTADVKSPRLACPCLSVLVFFLYYQYSRHATLVVASRALNGRAIVAVPR